MTIEIKGLADLERNLRQLDDRAAQRALRAGLAGAGRVVKAAAAREAPVRQNQRDLLKKISPKSSQVRAAGFLRRRIIYRSVRGRLAINVGPAREAWYGQYFEFGRRGRLSTKKADKGTRGPAGAAFPRRPFLTRAWASSAPAALAKFAELVERAIERELAKLSAPRR